MEAPVELLKSPPRHGLEAMFFRLPKPGGGEWRGKLAFDRHLLLVGANGSGKTSLLRLIPLGLGLPPADAQRLLLGRAQEGYASYYFPGDRGMVGFLFRGSKGRSTVLVMRSPEEWKYLVLNLALPEELWWNLPLHYTEALEHLAKMGWVPEPIRPGERFLFAALSPKEYARLFASEATSPIPGYAYAASGHGSLPRVLGLLMVPERGDLFRTALAILGERAILSQVEGEFGRRWDELRRRTNRALGLVQDLQALRAEAKGVEAYQGERQGVARWAREMVRLLAQAEALQREAEGRMGNLEAELAELRREEERLRGEREHLASALAEREGILRRAQAEAQYRLEAALGEWNRRKRALEAAPGLEDVPVLDALEVRLQALREKGGLEEGRLRLEALLRAREKELEEEIEGRLRALEAEEEALRQERATWRNRLEAEREALRQGLEAARRALWEVEAEAQEALRQREDRWREVARERLGKLLEDRKGEREALASYLVAERARWEAEWERRELERLLGERQRELEALRQEGEARWPKELGGTLWEFLEGALPGWRDTVGRVVRPELLFRPAKALMPLVREGAEGVYGLHLELRALEPFVDPREEWERNLLRVEASLQGLRENWERERGYWEEAHQGAASRQRALEEAGRKVDGLLEALLEEGDREASGRERLAERLRSALEEKRSALRHHEEALEALERQAEEEEARWRSRWESLQVQRRAVLSEAESRRRALRQEVASPLEGELLALEERVERARRAKRASEEEERARREYEREQDALERLKPVWEREEAGLRALRERLKGLEEALAALRAKGRELEEEAKEVREAVEILSTPPLEGARREYAPLLQRAEELLGEPLPSPTPTPVPQDRLRAQAKSLREELSDAARRLREGMERLQGMRSALLSRLELPVLADLGRTPEQLLRLEEMEEALHLLEDRVGLELEGLRNQLPTLEMVVLEAQERLEEEARRLAKALEGKRGPSLQVAEVGLRFSKGDTPKGRLLDALREAQRALEGEGDALPTLRTLRASMASLEEEGRSLASLLLEGTALEVVLYRSHRGEAKRTPVRSEGDLAVLSQGNRVLFRTWLAAALVRVALGNGRERERLRIPIPLDEAGQVDAQNLEVALRYAEEEGIALLMAAPQRPGALPPGVRVYLVNRQGAQEEMLGRVVRGLPLGPEAGVEAALAYAPGLEREGE